MTVIKTGEYLAPEVEVVELQFRESVLFNASIIDSITDSEENPVVGW